MLIVKNLVVFCLFCSIASGAKRIAKVHKFVSVDCESKDESIVTVGSCEIKPNGSMDMSFEFIQKAYDIYVDIK